MKSLNIHIAFCGGNKKFAVQLEYKNNIYIESFSMKCCGIRNCERRPGVNQWWPLLIEKSIPHTPWRTELAFAINNAPTKLSR